MNEQARIRAAIARHPCDKCMSCGSTFQVEGLLDVREDIPLQRLATAIGTQVCRLFPPHPCQAWWSNFKPGRTVDAGQRDAPVDAAGTRHRINRPSGSASEPHADGNDGDGRIWHLLDQAIQETARSEFIRLYEGLSRKKTVRSRVRDALRSLDRLRKGGVPDYDDPWTALFYLTWYQPRHINLVYSHLKSTNAQLPQILRVVDLGCGSLATVFALALFAATSGQHEARISVHGFDPNLAMPTLGLELRQRFAKSIREAATSSVCRNPMLKLMDRLINRMSVNVSTSMDNEYQRLLRRSERARATQHKTWLTAIHAAYHLPSELRTEILEWDPTGILITADHSRSPELDNVLLKLDGIQYSFHTGSVEPEVIGCLTRTTKWRQRLREWIIGNWGSFELDSYLDREVRWNSWERNKRPIVKQAGTFQ